jgi:hypothetical protein
MVLLCLLAIIVPYQVPGRVLPTDPLRKQIIDLRINIPINSAGEIPRATSFVSQRDPRHALPKPIKSDDHRDLQYVIRRSKLSVATLMS